MIKIIKPLLFYLASIILFLILLISFSMGSLDKAFNYFSVYYLYFNILFSTLYFFINRYFDYKIISSLSLFALILTLIICEIIYPNILTKKIILPYSEVDEVGSHLPLLDKPIEENIIPYDNISRAKYYLDKKEYSSAWIYADISLSENNSTEGQKLKEIAELELSKLNRSAENPKYIEIIRYNKLVEQNNILDAYYFCLDKINEAVYDQEFLIKLESCFQELLKKFYSIDYVQNKLNAPGYSDIKFYDTSSAITLYTIDKLVEDKGEYFLQNVTIDDYYYPYIYVDLNGNIFSSGFKENFNFVYNFEKPIIPIKLSELKLFSKEMYALSNSSLHFNMKIFNFKNIKYFRESQLSNTIVSRLTGYSLISIIFFMVPFGMNKRDYLNYLFVNTVTILSIKWFIKKIGLMIIYSGLGLTFIIISILYLIWLLLLVKKVNPLHARF